MADGVQGNQTSVTEFILLGFGNQPELHFLVFLVFLVIYIMTMVGNTLLVVLVVADQRLHTPMYFFLANLSSLETCYSSTILPRMLVSLLTGKQTISFNGCMIQYYFFSFLAGTECYFLTIMSYDRYLAICDPLHYLSFMNGKSCLQLGGGSCLTGFICSVILTSWLSQLTFCDPNECDHFFCDIIPLMKLSCSDLHLMKILVYTLALIFTVTPFLLTISSYICIILTILRIPSTTGKRKAFSTCSSHLIVVNIFYLTIAIVYMFPPIDTMRDLSKVFSVFYSVLAPLVNPLIYSLRNKEVKEALWKVLSKRFAFQGMYNMLFPLVAGELHSSSPKGSSQPITNPCLS